MKKVHQKSVRLTLKVSPKTVKFPTTNERYCTVLKTEEVFGDPFFLLSFMREVKEKEKKKISKGQKKKIPTVKFLQLAGLSVSFPGLHSSVHLSRKASEARNRQA